MDNFVIVTGCSGGGKSTLLQALHARGFATVEEPGRRIVRHQQAVGGRALPWIDLKAFAEEAVRLGQDDRNRMAGHDGWVFFDRSLVDAASALALPPGILQQSRHCGGMRGIITASSPSRHGPRSSRRTTSASTTSQPLLRNTTGSPPTMRS